MPLTATGTEVYFATMITVISKSYAYLEDTLNNLKCLNLKYHIAQNIAECCATILLDDGNPDSAGAFKPDHLGYTPQIFEITSDRILYFR